MAKLYVYLCFFAYFGNLVLYRLYPAGDPPSPRAAHAAAAVGTMVVFQVRKEKHNQHGSIITMNSR